MHPVPRPPSSLLGREADLTRILDRLCTTRWVTLTGLGGVGKTRLALALGAILEDAGGSVGYCDAVGLRSIDELTAAMAQLLDVDPRRETAPAQTSTLILDNLEHLAPAAGDALVDWLSRTPTLRLLVTSRVALARPEEIVVPVLPIDAATPDSPAVALLMARSNTPEGSPWRNDRGALCRLATRLDGVPLALELAAARASFLSPDELTALLDERLSLGPGDGDPLARGASRDAAVAWSWSELQPRFRDALARLAVITGSFDLELAAAVVGGSRVAALEAMEVLTRHSLLVSATSPQGVRQRLLETVRDFALAQTSADTITAAQDALAEALLARVEPHLTMFSRALPPDIARGVAHNRDLYLDVLRRGLTDPRPVALTHALRVAAALVPLFQRAGFGRIATELATTLLERDDIERAPLPARLGAAMVTVVAATKEADAAALVDRLVGRLDAWLTAGDAPLSHVTHLIRGALGVVHYYRWDMRPLLAVAESALRSELAARSPELAAYATAAQVAARRALGLASLAEDDARLTAALARLAPNDATTAGIVVLTRAFLATQLGEPARGLALASEGRAHARAAGLGWIEALDWLEIGRALTDLGHLDEADAALTEALSAFDPKSAMRERQETELDRALIAVVAGRYGHARARLAATESALETTFERALHAALTTACAALTGHGERMTPTPTDTVEDGACLALTAIGREPELVAAARKEAAASAPCSFRARLALALLDATHDLTGENQSTIAVADDDTAFRAGPSWIDLASRPLTMRLLSVLTDARLGRRGEPVTREALADALWPDERMSTVSRDQRLHTAVSALRKLGLDALETHAGGYRLSPHRALVRVSAKAWPGPTGELKRARGRGRPPRTPKTDT